MMKLSKGESIFIIPSSGKSGKVFVTLKHFLLELIQKMW